jgi:excisionase family DNA binding protein
MKRKDSPEAKKKTELDRPVSVEWLAEYMGCTPRFLRNEIRDGHLKARRLSARMFRLLPSDVKEWLDRSSTISE